MESSNNITYNKCKTWQVIFFSTSNLVSNAFLLLMMFVSYLAVGNYGILVGVASVIITASRIFDSITDPLIALAVEKTDGRFGRYRPMILLGYLLMTASILFMYFFSVGGSTITFIILYIVYIIGYTFYNTASNGARSVITNEPKQRGSIGRWGAIMLQIMAVGFSFYASNYLFKKHQGINLEALQELAITAIILSGIAVILTIVALRDKDKPEYYSNISNEPVKLRTIWKVLKGNKNLQMFMFAATSDKLAQQTSSNSAINVMIWGIVAGNYAFYGQLNVLTLVPMILLMLYGTQGAMKKGSKHATIRYSIFNILMGLGISAMFIFGDPTQIGKNFGMTALFLVVYSLYVGGRGITNAVVQPMVSDIADYELYRTGQFIPGVVSAVYGFIDKMVSSLATTIVGFVLAYIGYVNTMPQEADPYSAKILYVGLFLWMGIPILGWICSIIAMKWYELDANRMEEIQIEIADRKEALKTV